MEDRTTTVPTKMRASIARKICRVRRLLAMVGGSRDGGTPPGGRCRFEGGGEGGGAAEVCLLDWTGFGGKLQLVYPHSSHANP